MKGLLLNSLDKKEEAYKLGREGLKRNLKSHVCWHVLGLIYRSDRNYAEASKCYKSALRMDPGNNQIMRDLSLLQLHERDLVGYADTRRQLLAAKPSFKQNWLSYAVSEHLRGSPSSALDVLQRMDTTFADQEEDTGKYEVSEMIMYKASLWVEAGNVDNAVALLMNPLIVDHVGKLEMLTHLYYIKRDMESCKSSLTELIKVNATHEGYLLTLLSVLDVISPRPSAEQVKKWLRLGDTSFCASRDWSTVTREKLNVGKRSVKVLTESTGVVLRGFKVKDSSAFEIVAKLAAVKAEYIGGKCDQFDLITLYLLPSDSSEFVNALTSFVQMKLNKGVPSTFKMLKGLYAQSTQKGEAVKAVLSSLVKGKASPESPVLKTFALFALAQHFDFVGEFEHALESVTQALELTPTLIDLYVLKGKILKHSGDLAGSSVALESAREMDLADRYLNSKSVKALLRIGEVDKAAKTVMLFSKDTANIEKSNLTEMQCMWYELELGKALAAKGSVSKALNVWADTRKHYDDMAEDEFDFAFYCLRKMTLRAYIDFLRLEDKLTGHWFYRRMAKESVAVLLKIAKGELTEENEVKPKKSKKKADDAPVVLEINWFKDKDAVAEATTIVNELVATSSEWKGTYKISFELGLHTSKFLTCIRDVSKLKSLGSSKWAQLLARLTEAVKAKGDDVTDKESVERELAALTKA